MKRELTKEATKALVLNAVVKNKKEHADRHTHGDVRVCCWHNLEGHMLQAPKATYRHRDLWQPVHWYQVHHVHQYDPDKDRQTQWAHVRILIVKARVNLGFYEFEDALNKVLYAAWHVGRCTQTDITEEK